MQCPVCATEVNANDVVCNKCGATKVTRRTTVGVFVGWGSMVVGLIWFMLWVPVLFLPFVGYDMSEYPWTTLIIGTIVAAVLYWYSRSTIHSEWIPRED